MSRVTDLLPVVAAGVRYAAAEAMLDGMPPIEIGGRPIHALVAATAIDRVDAPPPSFWHAAFAIQLAHECLRTRTARDERSAGSAAVTAPGEGGSAILHNDHRLACAYRAASRAESAELMTLFARAVERSLAAELALNDATGESLDDSRYESIVLDRNGELFGCALAAGPVLDRRSDAVGLFDAGRRIGLLHRRVDDLLDCCPHARPGDPCLSEYTNGRWTWVLELDPSLTLGMDPADVLDVLHGSRDDGAPMQRALDRLESERARLHAALQWLPGADVLADLTGEWLATAHTAVAIEAEHRSPRRRALPVAVELALRGRVPGIDDVDGHLAQDSRTFHFASRLFGREDAARVARVHAFCRITADLVNRPIGGVHPEHALDVWVTLARKAYEGGITPFPLIGAVMDDMAEHRVPFTYAVELVEGVRMDLHGGRFGSLAELRRYTYRVAAVPALWLTRLFGVEDESVLGNAEHMGHAMQLTRILRDVGEHWDAGRLYLPQDRMRIHGVDEAAIARMRAGAPVSLDYRALIEDLLRVAEVDYDAALAAVPLLPISLARPAAIAANVYRGIHREIRRSGYDNLHRRARTDPLVAGLLAGRALWKLYLSPRPSFTSRARAPAQH